MAFLIYKYTYSLYSFKTLTHFLAQICVKDGGLAKLA